VLLRDDVTSTDGVADVSVVTARIRSRWNKIRQLAPFLIAKDTSMHI